MGVFDKEKVYRCETDCWTDGCLYRRGDLVTAKECPPHFKVTDINPEDLKGKEEE